MSPIEQSLLPPQARQVVSCSGFSSVHLRHDHMLKDPLSCSSSCCLTTMAPTLLLLIPINLSGDSLSLLEPVILFSSFTAGVLFSFFEFLLLRPDLRSPSSCCLASNHYTCYDAAWREWASWSKDSG